MSSPTPSTSSSRSKRPVRSRRRYRTGRERPGLVSPAVRRVQPASPGAGGGREVSAQWQPGRAVATDVTGAHAVIASRLPATGQDDVPEATRGMQAQRSLALRQRSWPRRLGDGRHWGCDDSGKPCVAQPVVIPEGRRHPRNVARIGSRCGARCPRAPAPARWCNTGRPRTARAPLRRCRDGRGRGAGAGRGRRTTATSCGRCSVTSAPPLRVRGAVRPGGPR
jgi:hypothetical protein